MQRPHTDLGGCLLPIGSSRYRVTAETRDRAAILTAQPLSSPSQNREERCLGVPAFKQWVERKMDTWLLKTFHVRPEHTLKAKS